MSADLPSEAPAAVPRLPWPALAAALVAFAALAQTGHGYGLASFELLASVPGLLSLGLLAACLLPQRFAANSWSAWLARVVLMTVVVLANVESPCKVAGHGIYDPAYVHAFGQLCAAELVVQAWRERPSGGQGGYAALLLSGLVFLVACNTFDVRFLLWYTPAYAVCLFAAVRASRPRLRRAGALVWRLPAAWLAGVFVLFAFGLGYAVTNGLHKNKDRLAALVRQLDDAVLGRRSTGFSGAPMLGRRMSLQRSMRRILKLEGAFPGSHLRGLSFDTYQQGRWGPLVANRRLDALPVAKLRAGEMGLACRITRLEDGFPYLFAPLDSAGLLPDRVQEVERDVNQGAVLRVTAPAPYSYNVQIAREPGRQGPLCAPLTAAERERCLAVPEKLDQGVVDKALEITQGAGGPLERVQAVEAHLTTKHRYSLTATPGAGDPVADFILHEDRAAHCEYFASAATLLLRCLGIPSRYVVGYYAHEGHGEGQVIVREQDAHAWCEAWIDGVGWVTVEATPADGRPERAAEEVSFWRGAWEWLHDTALAIGDWIANLSFIQLGLLFGGLTSAVVLLLWLREMFARRRMRPAKARSYSAPEAALGELAARFEALLARLGAPCPPQRTWQEHLAALAATNAEQGAPPFDAGAANEFVQAYNTWRFGAAFSDEQIRSLDERLRALEMSPRKRILSIR